MWTSSPRRVCPRWGLLGVALVAMGVFVSSTGPALAAPSPAPAPTNWAACPTALPALGRPTTSVTASPLPPVKSTVGGARLAAPGVQVDAAAPPPAPSRATAWLVADADTGAVLAACNAHLPLAPASTLKLLTALALLPQIPDAAHYVATDDAASVDGTKVGLVPGLSYTGKDLWHGLLMTSGNDCAVALAELSGGQDAAIARLNDMARSLGARDSRAANTSGLDAPGQVSSTYDLALFARAALAQPRLLAIAQARDYSFPGKPSGASSGPSKPSTTTGGRTRFQIQNHDRLLYNYPGATGLKNGWTSTAGGSFVGTATRNDRTYIVTMLRSDTNTWRATAALLDWAFANGDTATPVGALITPQQAAALDNASAGATSAAPTASGSAPATASATTAPVVTRPGSAAPGALVVAGAMVATVALGAGIWLSRSRSPARAPERRP